MISTSLDRRVWQMTRISCSRNYFSTSLTFPIRWLCRVNQWKFGKISCIFMYLSQSRWCHFLFVDFETIFTNIWSIHNLCRLVWSVNEWIGELHPKKSPTRTHRDTENFIIVEICEEIFQISSRMSFSFFALTFSPKSGRFSQLSSSQAIILNFLFWLGARDLKIFSIQFEKFFFTQCFPIVILMTWMNDNNSTNLIDVPTSIRNLI